MVIDYCTHITGDVVARSFFGKDLRDCQVNGKSLLLEISMLINDISHHYVTDLWFGLRFQILSYNVWNYFLTSYEKSLYRRVT